MADATKTIDHSLQIYFQCIRHVNNNNNNNKSNYINQRVWQIDGSHDLLSQESRVWGMIKVLILYLWGANLCYQGWGLKEEKQGKMWCYLKWCVTALQDTASSLAGVFAQAMGLCRWTARRTQLWKSPWEGDRGETICLVPFCVLFPTGYYLPNRHLALQVCH